MFPNVAEFGRSIDKLLGYQSTHIEITLQHDDAATRQALIAALTPLMQEGGRDIAYRVVSRTGSHVERAAMPSYYRFSNGKLEIAAGGIIGNDILNRMTAGLKAVAQYRHLYAIPDRVPVTLRSGSAEIPAVLLPRTANLITERSFSPWGSASTESACYVEVQALFSTEQFGALFMGGQYGVFQEGIGEVKVPAQPGLRDTQYRLVGIAPVPGEGGRTVKELETDATQIYGYVRMQPASFRSGIMDCDLTLPRMTDPTLMAASMFSTLPRLEGHVQQVSVETAQWFSPWWSRGGWIAVAPGDQAQAGTRACYIEWSRHIDATMATYNNKCDTSGADAATCKRFTFRESFAGQELELCERNRRMPATTS